MLRDVSWGAWHWFWPCVGLGIVIAMVLIWSYAKRLNSGVAVLSLLLKLLAVALVVVCLLEPRQSGTRPKPQANMLALMVDNSQSMSMQHADGGISRGDRVKQLLDESNPWRVRIAQDFDVRGYQFGPRLEPLDQLDKLRFDGHTSALSTSLTTLGQRLEGRPVAGVLLFSDGNLTDPESLPQDWSKLGFPVFPVIPSEKSPPGDLRIADASVSQTDFETSPVTIRVVLASQSMPPQTVVVQLKDQRSNRVIQEQTVAMQAAPTQETVTLKFRPEQSGVGFFKVTAFREADRTAMEQNEVRSEATFVNNSRWFAIDRGQGPHRILYVSGRPNWDFKFLRRAIQNDPELKIVGLLRIANKEPKFSFRDRDVSSTNPLFAGIGGEEEVAAQQYDEPVMLRLGVDVSEELSDGFPKTSEELFGYEAVILDDLEPEFFTEDQLLMLRRFVSARGGGLLLLGGLGSFDSDRFGSSPLGELAPVYPRRSDDDSVSERVRLELTREGLLQPWYRLRETEDAEAERLRAMPSFETLSIVGAPKPGAVQLATLRDNLGKPLPGLVVQRFGRGKSGALMLGDSWKWSMRREKANEDEPARLWRQTLRWLVSDVPRRVHSSVQSSASGDGRVVIQTDVLDESYVPIDNAKVELEVGMISTEAEPQKPIKLMAQADDRQPGRYLATYFAGSTGGYAVASTVTANDGSEIGRTNTGWVAQPGESEFKQWAINQEQLSRIATQSGGEVVSEDELERFVSDLEHRKVPVMQTWSYPLWHQPWIMLAAMLCLCGEWGLRRWKGLP